MRKLAFITATGLCCLFFSCKDDGKGGDMTASEKNKAATKEIYKAIETGDVSKLDSFFAKDAIDHSGPNGPIVGSDSIKKFLADIHNQMDGLKLTLIADATDGEYQFSLGRMQGTCKTNSMGMPAGTKCDMLSVDVTKLKDGKATDHWAYMDPADMMKMMGGGATPPAADAKKMDSTKMK